MTDYILRKQIGPSFKNKFLYFCGDKKTSIEYKDYTTKNPGDAELFTEGETREFSKQIHEGAFKEVKVD